MENTTQNIIPLKPDFNERRAIRRVYSASGLALLLFLLYQMVFGEYLVTFITDLFYPRTAVQYGNFANIASIALTVLFELCVIALGCKLAHIKPRSFFNLNGFSGGTIAKTYFIAQGGGYIFSVVGVIVTVFIGLLAARGSADAESLIPAVPQLMQTSPIVSVVVSFYGILGAPFMEELLFRGLILFSLKKYNHTFAIVVSALAFGLTHGNIQQAFYTAFMGIVLGAVALRYNSIVPTIFAHAIVNIIGLGLTTLFNITGLLDIMMDPVAAATVVYEVPIYMLIIIGVLVLAGTIGITALIVVILNRRRFREFFNRATPLGKSRALPVFITSVPWLISFAILIFYVFAAPFL
jgi:membrane protease YdiL (CAAX protease family)